SPPSRIKFERLIATRADRVIATCRDEVAELERMGVPRSRASVVPCGVDLSLFTPDGEVADRADGMRRLVSVGRLVQRKGFDTAIRALPLLPDTELLIAGGGGNDHADQSERRRLIRLAAEHGVSDRVRLLGQVPRA